MSPEQLALNEPCKQPPTVHSSPSLSYRGAISRGGSTVPLPGRRAAGIAAESSMLRRPAREALPARSCKQAGKAAGPAFLIVPCPSRPAVAALGPTQPNHLSSASSAAAQQRSSASVSSSSLNDLSHLARGLPVHSMHLACVDAQGAACTRRGSARRPRGSGLWLAVCSPQLRRGLEDEQGAAAAWHAVGASGVTLGQPGATPSKATIPPTGEGKVKHGAAGVGHGHQVAGGGGGGNHVRLVLRQRRAGTGFGLIVATRYLPASRRCCTPSTSGRSSLLSGAQLPGQPAVCTGDRTAQIAGVRALMQREAHLHLAAQRHQALVHSHQRVAAVRMVGGATGAQRVWHRGVGPRARPTCKPPAAQRVRRRQALPHAVLKLQQGAAAGSPGSPGPGSRAHLPATSWSSSRDPMASANVSTWQDADKGG